MTERTIRIKGHEFEVSSLDKALFPQSAISKGEVIDYYRRIAPIMLPHIENRPLTMQRFPDGIEASGFFQKDIPDYFPAWIERVELDKENGKVNYCLGNNEATLVYLANQACITLHVGLSRIDKIDVPDRMVLDLDPSGDYSDDDFARIQKAALRISDLLQRLQLTAFVQTTGSRGLHVLVPLERRAGFDEVREFAKKLARRLAEQYPRELTIEQRKDKRGDKIFIDYLRNAYGQTMVAPYTLRAAENAPLAAPLDWSELNARDLTPRKYTLKTIFRRLAQKEDPWLDLRRRACSLDEADRLLSRL